MRRVAVVLVIAAGILSVAGPARAHHNGHEFATSEECIASGTVMNLSLIHI